MAEQGAALKLRPGEQVGETRVVRMSRAIDRVLDLAMHSWNEERHLRNNRFRYEGMFGGRHRQSAPKTYVERLRINGFHQAITGIEVNTAYGDAIVEITPWNDRKLMGVSRMMSAHVGCGLRRLNFTRMSRRVLHDALFMRGVFRTGRARVGGGLEWAEKAMESGEAYIRRVSPGDSVLDVTARDWEEVQIIGHRYSAALPDVQEEIDDDGDGLVRTAERFGLTTEDVNALLNRDAVSYDQPVEMVDLLRLWVAPGLLSREAMVLTLSGDMENLSGGGKGDSRGNRKPIDMREYDGPPMGGYSVMTLSDVSDSVVGTPLGGFIADVYDLRSSMLNHAIECILREKKLLLGPKGNGTDQAAIRDANNMGVVGLDSTKDDWEEKHFGGVSQEFFAGFGLIDQECAKQSGSDQLNARPVASGGRNVTATEVQGLQAQLSVKLDAVGEQFYDACDRAMSGYVHYALLDNPDLDETVTISVGSPKTGKYNIPVRLTSADLRGYSSLDWNFRIRRGSMRRVSQQEKAAFVERFAMSVIPDLIF